MRPEDVASELVEKAARAEWEHLEEAARWLEKAAEIDPDPTPWGVLSEASRDVHRDRARHALAAALDVPQMAAAIVGHENTDTLPGDSETLVCGGCDHVLITGDPDDDRDAQAEHATHHATLIRAAILGGAA